MDFTSLTDDQLFEAQKRYRNALMHAETYGQDMLGEQARMALELIEQEFKSRDFKSMQALVKKERKGKPEGPINFGEIGGSDVHDPKY